ncbi:hypothetical protein CRYUN_Cryun18bG0040900 [Craigia yunnanensis]
MQMKEDGSSIYRRAPSPIPPNFVYFSLFFFLWLTTKHFFSSLVGYQPFDNTNFKYEHNSTEISLDIKLNRLQHCHGLPYKNGDSSQNCSSVSIDDLSCNDEINFDIKVQNVGQKDVSDVVMVYSVPPEGIIGTPIKQLVGFERIKLLQG